MIAAFVSQIQVSQNTKIFNLIPSIFGFRLTSPSEDETIQRFAPCIVADTFPASLKIMSFLPDNYQTPQQQSNGLYLRFREGTTKFRILSKQAQTGWIYWTDENKPVRVREKPPSDRPEGIRCDDKGRPEKIKHFWVMVVYDYGSEQPCILEITQATIQRSIHALCTDSDWGNPNDFDIKVTRSGAGLETDYQIAPVPHKPFDYGLASGWEEIDLEKLFTASDPFADNGTNENHQSVVTEPHRSDSDRYLALGFSSQSQFLKAWEKFEQLNDEAKFLGLDLTLDPAGTTLEQLSALATEMKAALAESREEIPY